MNTITIAINNVIGGDPGVAVHGEAKWIKNYCVDLRTNKDYVHKVSNHEPMLFLTLIEQGTLYTILKAAHGGRDNDYLSTWIFVPSEVSISGKELKALIENIINLMKAPIMDDSVIDKLTTNHLPVRVAVPQYRASLKEGKDAVRYYGGAGWSLSEILDSPFQSYYSDYERVFLIDSASNVKYGEAQDVSGQELVNLVDISPVKDPHGFTAFIGNKEFNSPICVEEGRKLKIIWRKGGYSDIELPFVVSKGKSLPLPQSNNIKRIVNLDSIRVVDKKTGGNIHAFSVTIENSRYDSSQQIAILESSFSSTKATILAVGYHEEHIALCEAIGKIVYLKPCQYIYNIRVIIDGGNYDRQIVSQTQLNTWNLYLPSAFHARKRNLVEGKDKFNIFDYKPTFPSEDSKWVNRQNYSKPSDPRNSKLISRRNIGSWVLGVVVIIAIAFVGFVVYSWLTPEATMENINEPVLEEDSISQVTPEKIDAYLDGNITWKRDSLQSLGLDDLFEAMVDFQFDKIKNIGSTKSIGSKTFQKLLEAIKESQSYDINLTGTHYPNAEQLGQISVENYMNYIRDKGHDVDKQNIVDEWSGDPSLDNLNEVHHNNRNIASGKNKSINSGESEKKEKVINKKKKEHSNPSDNNLQHNNLPDKNFR